MNSRLRILMVSTSYPKNDRDWRGRFIANIVAALGRDPDLDLSVWAPPGYLPGGSKAAASLNDSVWLDDLIARGGIAAILRSGTLGAATKSIGLLRRLRRLYQRSNDFDIAHINWLQNALPLWGLRIPALITVLGSDYGLLRYAPVRRSLRAVLRQRRCLIAPNAGWMLPRLQEYFGDVADIETIPFGVDPDWFRCRRTPEAGGTRWLVVSRVTSAKIGTLFDWGSGQFENGREIHLLGPQQESMNLPTWIRYHGPTNPGELMSRWFPQSTGLITLSNHDEGRPQVMLEAMAAGLPVIASDHPAHRDIIQHGITGFIVRNASEFGAALRALEVPEQNLKIGEKARDWVIGHIGTWDDCARRYKNSYQRLIKPIEINQP